MKLAVKFFEEQHLVASTELGDTLELGRQRQGEPEPHEQDALLGNGRMLIAGRGETNVSRRHLLLTRNADGTLTVDNLNQHLPIRVRQLRGSDPTSVEDAEQQTQILIAPGNKTQLKPPLLLLIGDKAIRIECVEAPTPQVTCFATTSLPPGSTDKTLEPFHTLFAAGKDIQEREAVLNWLHTTMGVFQQAASSPEFFSDAARAVVKIVELDAAGILFHHNDEWTSRAIAFSDHADESSWHPSHTILNRVVTENRVFRQLPEPTDGGQESLQDVVAVVAAPILSAEGEVIGAIYGDRRQQPGALIDVEITLLEAKLVELLASAVAAGLARLKQEQAAVAARTQFEQFFSPELAQQLELDPHLLEGRDTEVTLLFVDIRGFSRVTEQLGPSATVTWINDVLGRLSECVFAESGVLIEYVGDELFAMWGAPKPCADQAQRACQAALRMLNEIPQLQKKWQSHIGESFQVGIGINTGTARVGNVGSQHRFKYGPLGNAVNLASRLQGATKYLGCPLLISGATASQLDDSFATRRLCTIRVNNIREPVEIYEVAAAVNPKWQQFQSEYGSALAHFEKSEFPESLQVLAGLVARFPTDSPSVLLMSRAVEMISRPSLGDFDPVWELPGK